MKLFELFKNKKFWWVCLSISFGTLGLINIFRHAGEGYFITSAYFLTSLIYLLIVLKSNK